MDADRDHILSELRRYAAAPETPRPRKARTRADILSALIERDPPTRHGYPMLSLVLILAYAIGVGMLLIGLTMLVIASTSPTTSEYYQSLPSDGAPKPPNMPLRPLIDFENRLAVGSSAVACIVAGVYMLINAQGLQLMLDVQGNLDRQAFALHGVFFLLLSERKESSDEHT